MSGGASATFSYDGIGRQRAKTVLSTSTTLLYDGDDLLQERSGPTSIVNLLTGLSVDETFLRTEEGATSTLVVDVLGSSLAPTDASGAVQASYTYEPFGATTLSGREGALGCLLGR